MKNFEKMGEELLKSGKAEQIKALAQTEGGQRLTAMVDSQALERAARDGDARSLEKILGQILATPEGRELKRSIDQIMGG